MNNKHSGDMVFEINQEEGEYIEHIKTSLFNDDSSKNDSNNKPANIGKFRKSKTVEKENAKTSSSKNIHSGHRKRLRETFNNVNPLSMPEHQILEIMISFVQPRKDVNPLAHELLNEFGSLSAVFEASIDDLKKVNGVGEILASYIHFCSKLPAIYNNSKLTYKTKLSNIAETIDYIKNKVSFGSQEEFFYLCLNNKSNILCFKSLGKGNISNIYIDVRVLLRQILKYPTKSLVICHTHPNGMPSPSSEDRKFTLELFSLLEHLNIRLLDHIIISPEGYFSFFQNGTESLGQDADLRSKILFNSSIFNINNGF